LKKKKNPINLFIFFEREKKVYLACDKKKQQNEIKMKLQKTKTVFSKKKKNRILFNTLGYNFLEDTKKR
jgi:hypothetical protein